MRTGRARDAGPTLGVRCARDPALARCAAQDPSGRVALECAASASPQPLESVRDLAVLVVATGETAPAPQAPFSLVRADGLIRSGQSDRRGSVWEAAAPRGPLRLAVPAEKIIHEGIDERRAHDDQAMAPQRLELKQAQRRGHRHLLQHLPKLHDVGGVHREFHGPAEGGRPGHGLHAAESVVDHLERRHLAAHHPLLRGQVQRADAAGLVLLLRRVDIARVHAAEQRID